ncbi:distal tail protein Dit [Salinicoccus roseus]|uniref:distal tail protein Dit n=1 Tax=Salinicoccus roseus TaxID=45670 RepID=UPI00352589C4
MIEFELPGERTGGLHLPSSHQLIVEGVNIDETLTDINCTVETLNIAGRQLNSYDIQTSTPAGYDGVMVLSKRMASKTISVTVEIDAVVPEVAKEKISSLNALLRSARHIQFSDESDLKYYVTYEGGSTPDDEATKQSFVLDFLWHDPLKYRDECTIDYTNAEALTIDSTEPVQPYIEIKFDTGVKEWSLRNTTTDMNINYSHENVSSVYRLYLEDQTLTKNVTETDAMDGLNIESDMEDFTVKDGDQLVVTPTPAIITIKYRGVSL